MVVETLFMLFSDELTEIQQAGTRILTCIEPVDLLARMFPTDDLKRRTDAAVEALAAARTLRFTNGAGTDVTYRIGYPVKAQYGYVDSARASGTTGRRAAWCSPAARTTGSTGASSSTAATSCCRSSSTCTSRSSS